MTKVIVIDDDRMVRLIVEKGLNSIGIHVISASLAMDGLQLVETEKPDVALVDVSLPEMNGFELFRKIRAIDSKIPMIFVTSDVSSETTIEAMRLGAFDYISKPPDLNRLLNTVRNALDRKKLVVENKILKKKVSKNYEMIGESEAINHIKMMIDKVAPTEARVLITGPNGTGKELVAHQLHEKSERASFPLIEVNCAAIPSELIESELFGHVKGAFTSAVKDRAGKFEAADKGTIFLDEIGDMSLSAQAKVLRALQESMITRVGADKDIKVDVRVVAATNKDLKQEIAEGRFREDLYHRLAVILIKVPALNERRTDIPMLVTHFAEKIASEQGNAVKKFSEAAISLLQEYDWTGNIRELRNVVERLIILGGSEISETDVKLFASK